MFLAMVEEIDLAFENNTKQEEDTTIKVSDLFAVVTLGIDDEFDEEQAETMLEFIQNKVQRHTHRFKMHWNGDPKTLRVRIYFYDNFAHVNYDSCFTWIYDLMQSMLVRFFIQDFHRCARPATPPNILYCDIRQ